MKNPFKKKKKEKKKRIVKSTPIPHPSTNSSIDRKGSGEKFGKNIFFSAVLFPFPPLPYAERLQRVEARQSGRTRKHSGRKTSLNKSA